MSQTTEWMSGRSAPSSIPWDASPHRQTYMIKIAEVEDQTGCINLEKFLPAMTKVLMEHKFPSVPEDLLLQAFEVLDKENKGYLEPEQLAKYMTQEGELFTQEEMDEMLTALADHENNRVYYKDLLNQWTIDPDM
uniref:dynein regulatory complex protein 8 isoform X1 n=1 Tax=Gasterosteus aculeatus aculeatus TaxID=481459 RepID=UPI001A98AD6A|nr:dynein regulatory complex protein 8 isoform X1 [Gasterosteus aculeatus aculeatus]XP_040055189.1 dynein regulatory complex protein 8 isoform X1 [Gasterosteus aculeatus aculeatus]